jgi:signal transduction histidine kinase
LTGLTKEYTIRRIEFPDRKISMAADTAAKTSARARRLPASAVSFYREFVRVMPFGLAILHLPDPQRPSSWKLVAHNALAEQLVGRTMADFLGLPIAPATADGPRDTPTVFRSVSLSGKVALLGQVRIATANGPGRVFRARVYAVPYACVGLAMNPRYVTRDEGRARDLALQVTRAEERERKRISRELHDSIGQSLTGLHWKLSRIRREETSLNGLGAKLDECVDLAKACMDELRMVSSGLQPPVLEMLGLGPALQWQAKRFFELSELQVKLDIEPGIERLDPDSELSLFRVFQECLSNVRRHARTECAQARLMADAGHVILEVQDRGIGLPAACLSLAGQKHRGRGLGLLKMRERVAELGGSLEIESNESGTVIRASVPRRSLS